MSAVQQLLLGSAGKAVNPTPTKVGVSSALAFGSSTQTVFWPAGHAAAGMNGAGRGGSGGLDGSGDVGGDYGGGAGGNNYSTRSNGAVRIIWPGNLRQFPSTRTANE